ncbi:MAG: DUF1385 domain-containing protein [Clostridia bacterium]|nr:DUF1385 domain-containing protein [Clostridia bacterium]
MNQNIEKDAAILATPVAEGVRFEIGTATAFAVRNRSKDITVRVFQERHSLRNLLGYIPFVRGVVRFVNAFASLFSGLRESAELKPRTAVRGGGFSQEFSRLFRTTPVRILSFLSGLAIPLILLVMMFGLPGMVESGLVKIPGMPRAAVNVVCCLFRILGSILSVYGICHLKVLSRLCMYRGAAGKVINAYEAYGPELTHEEVMLSPRLTDRSDGAFLIVVMMLSIAAFAAVRTDGLLLQLGYRIGVILAAAAVSNEIILPLERANPNSLLAVLHRPLMGLQHLFTIEPHNQMIEVALCAFRAAYENDLSREE